MNAVLLVVQVPGSNAGLGSSALLAARVAKWGPSVLWSGGHRCCGVGGMCWVLGGNTRGGHMVQGHMGHIQGQHGGHMGRIWVLPGMTRFSSAQHGPPHTSCSARQLRPPHTHIQGGSLQHEAAVSPTHRQGMQGGSLQRGSCVPHTQAGDAGGLTVARGSSGTLAGPILFP